MVRRRLKVQFCRKIVSVFWALSIISFTVSTILVLQRLAKFPSKLKASGIIREVRFSGTTSKVGTVWPHPLYITEIGKTYLLLPDKFSIDYETNSVVCQEIDDAMKRYARIIFGSTTPVIERDDTKDLISYLKISISKSCEKYPSLKSSESYYLTVEKDSATLVSSTQWGILRGLETFSQLVHRSEKGEFIIKGVKIEDFPRFQHRGVMLDTARHFLPMESLLTNLEIMSYNKMNVLHWHITDRESFPIEFSAMPELAQKGAYNNRTMIYTEEDVRKVVEFARMRGIRVIPEIDFPGHSNALAKSVPDLFIECYDEETGELKYNSHSMNPVKPEVYAFIGRVYAELQKLFPDEYIHVGGDEVHHKCWFSNPDYKKYVEETGLDDARIHRRMQERILQEARKLNMKPIIWDDGFNNGYSKDIGLNVFLQSPTTVQVWFPKGAEEKVSDLTLGAVDLILSYPWYLDNTLHKDWNRIYLGRFAESIEEENDKVHILGGEACMWSEHIDETNVLNEVWPLSSSVAERLWSNETVSDEKEALKRLRNFQCVLESRGVKFTPIGPGYCDAQNKRGY